MEGAELSPKHVGTILIGKMYVNTFKLTSQLALFTCQSGSSRGAGSLPSLRSIPHTPNPRDQKGLCKENFLLCWLISWNEIEDTFIFSFPAFKGKWESYKLRSLWDKIEYRQCLAHSRTKSMNVYCILEGPNSWLRVVSIQVGCKGWGSLRGSVFPFWKATPGSWPRGQFEGATPAFHLWVGHNAAIRLDIPDALLFFLRLKKFIDREIRRRGRREREGRERGGERHRFVLLCIHALSGCFSYVPWLEVEPATSQGIYNF